MFQGPLCPRSYFSFSFHSFNFAITDTSEDSKNKAKLEISGNGINRPKS